MRYRAEEEFLRLHKSFMSILLDLPQFCFQKQTSDLWDQEEHLLQIGSFDLAFLISSCFWSSLAALNAGKALTCFDIASAPVFVVYWWEGLFQTGQELYPPLLRAAVFFSLLHFPVWYLLHEEHLVLYPWSPERADLIDSEVSCILVVWVISSRKR